MAILLGKFLFQYLRDHIAIHGPLILLNKLVIEFNQNNYEELFQIGSRPCKLVLKIKAPSDNTFNAQDQDKYKELLQSGRWNLIRSFDLDHQFTRM